MKETSPSPVSGEIFTACCCGDTIKLAANISIFQEEKSWASIASVLRYAPVRKGRCLWALIWPRTCLLSKLSLPAIVLAVGFSAAIGIFFGFYPAREASRLLPIQALRYE
jgi:ABC-type lipoprotein release transport system permease subunit